MILSNGVDKKSKVFFTVFFSLVFIVSAAAFYKFYILKDYYIKLEADCDPAEEQCFIYECDPAEDTECPENAADRLSYYKYLEKKASALPLCDLSDAACPPVVCQAGEDCREILCDQAAEAEGELCSNPANFRETEPKNIESDNNCAPEDEKCLDVGDGIIDLNEIAAPEEARRENQPRDIFRPIE